MNFEYMSSHLTVAGPREVKPFPEAWKSKLALDSLKKYDFYLK